MIAMCMVEVPLHQVVGMIAVGNRLVSAVGPVFVVFLVPTAFVLRGTRCLVFTTDGNLVLVNMITVRVMEMPIVKVVLVAVVLHDRMSAIRTVRVRVCFVDAMFSAHLNSPWVFG